MRTTQPYLIALIILISTASAINIPPLYNSNSNHIQPRTDPDDTNLPVPFDTSLDSDNFTNTACPHFLTANFASSPASSAFATCRPLSLLLRDSTEFFTTTLRSANATTGFLDAACAAPVESCSGKLLSLAKDLLNHKNCGRDYGLGNPLVVDAYQGLIAYEAVYRASCLKSSQTGRYCFVDALSSPPAGSNSSRHSSTSPPPGDYDMFSVPLGYPLTQDPAEQHGEGDNPAKEDPFLSCNECVRREMEVYAGFARRDGQPVAGSYLPSAQVVNRWCGEGFVDLNITLGAKKPAGFSSGVAVIRPRLSISGILLAVALVVLMGGI